MKIAIDCGGDGGYEPVLAGAQEALERNTDLELILFVGEDRLNGKSVNKDRLSTTVTPHTYSSEGTIRDRKSRKLETSIYQAIQTHKRKEVDAVIAPGDTIGSVIFASNHKEGLGLMNKVLKPALPTHWPVNNVIIDSGACVDCTPHNFYQFAIMGKVFSKEYLGIGIPSIGVLNVGQEKSKGRKLERQSKKLIDKLRNFGYETIDGFYEPAFVHRFEGGQVVVTDGFTGNVGLKFSEEVVKTYTSALKKEVEKQAFWRRFCAYKGLEIPKGRLKERFDWRKYSTAPLLGVNGYIMVCHGKSDAEAIASAVEITYRYVQKGVNEKLEQEIRDYA